MKIKKILYVLPLACLFSCNQVNVGNNVIPSGGTKMTYQDGSKKLNDTLNNLTKIDALGVSIKDANLYLKSVMTMDNLSSTLVCDIQDLDFDAKVSGLTTATDLNGMKASLEGHVKGSITQDEVKLLSVDASAKAYLTDSKLYLDFSDKGFKALLNSGTVTTLPYDKFFGPVTLDVEYPIINTEYTADFSELFAALDQINQTYSDFITYKSYNNYYGFMFEINKDNMKKVLEDYIDQIPVEEGVSSSEVTSYKEYYKSTINSMLEESKFNYVKFGMTFDSNCITSIAYDIDAGLITSVSQPDENGNLVTVKEIDYIKSKAKMNIAYNDNVKINFPSFVDYIDVEKAQSETL